MRVASVLTGLVGCEIGASRSPQIHEREADAQGIRLVYKLFDLTDTPDRLADILDAAALLGFAGLNVTHPFKQQVLPLLDALSEDARRIGAVNTVVREGGRWVGHNTDGIGFGDSLKRGLPAAELTKVVQFGAGGAGSATADALLALGARELVLVERDLARGETLAERLRQSFPNAVISAVETLERLDDASGVVNASPIGMYGHEGTPFDPRLLRGHHWVADVVYFPRDTELLRIARATGCPIVDGSGMVVLQAARAFELFTGRQADRARMLTEFERV
ncbi:shikimate dehydrogenase [Sphingomonas psychrotolerans]|uniref:Shikimate dehydrogenase (NADP(+)) n=1 Tax=Sphingomonas psychrotolerans TaxID=1327635 RepID=A0A2K8MSC1_9SPHN|nr:shikimate dehydrogenase [Sphingomonas psychrotolerans]